jgi:hypothetical protein
MSQSVTSALNSVRERTAGPGSDWQRATITDIAPPDFATSSRLLARPSHLVLTVTVQDGTELDWKCAMPWSDDETDACSYLMTATGNESLGDSLVGEPVWVRQRYARSEGVPDSSERWDRSGQWVLESSADRQRRQSFVYRWGRVLAASVLFLDLTLGLWRLVFQVALLLALAVIVEPAWAIVLGGLTILACEEVALKAIRE